VRFEGFPALRDEFRGGLTSFAALASGKSCLRADIANLANAFKREPDSFSQPRAAIAGPPATFIGEGSHFPAAISALIEASEAFVTMEDDFSPLPDEFAPLRDDFYARNGEAARWSSRRARSFSQ
jgi:hypothetical protein